LRDNFALKEKVELLCRVLWPYVQEIVSQVLNEKADLSEATAESLAEFVCFRVRRTVREMVDDLNERARKGEFEELRELIREDPELAMEALRYVATRFKRRIKLLIMSELSGNPPRGLGHAPTPSNGGSSVRLAQHSFDEAARG